MEQQQCQACFERKQEMEDVIDRLDETEQELAELKEENEDLKRRTYTQAYIDTLEQELADLKAEVESREVYTKEMELAASNAIKELTALKKLVIKYRRCLFKPYNPVEVDNDEFYEYDRQIEQAIKEE